jgi:hypothetical protein
MFRMEWSTNTMPVHRAMLGAFLRVVRSRRNKMGLPAFVAGPG